MLNRLIILALFFCITACSHRYYVVRHGEKATPPPGNADLKEDPNLSAAGTERARALLQRLQEAKITRVYSTATVRTESTAAPVATYFNLPIRKYGKVDSAFIRSLRSLKENVLVVGHSNTVDDIVNGLVPSANMIDLPETEYDNLYIIKKRGHRYSLQKAKYGQPSEQY